MSELFKPGDVVQHRTGGPVMIVEGYRPPRNDDFESSLGGYHVSWWRHGANGEGHFASGVFSAAALKAYEGEKPHRVTITDDCIVCLPFKDSPTSWHELDGKIARSVLDEYIIGQMFKGPGL